MMKDEEYYSFNDIRRYISSFFLYLRKKLWLFVVVFFIGAGLGAVYFVLQKPAYVASCTFILEDKSSGGGGGLAGLASQFGLSMGGLSGGSIFSGDNIIDILKSKKVVQQVLLSKVDLAANEGSCLADLYLDFTGLKKTLGKKEETKNIAFKGVQEQLSPVEDSVLSIIYEDVVKKNLFTERTSKQGTIIKVNVKAPNSIFARLMSERLVEAASKLYFDLRVGTELENIRQLQSRSDSLLLLLNNKSYKAAASQPLDINPGLRTAIVPVEIANRDKTVLATLYAEVTKNLEASKLMLSQQTPVIQLLDTPALLLDNNKKSLSLLIVLGALLSIIICMIFISLIYLANSIKGI